MAGLSIVDGFYSGDTQSCGFGYDDLSRLVSQSCGTVWGAEYSYDAFGNITKALNGSSPGTTFNPTFNLSTNQFSTIPGVTGPYYDTNGNVIYDGFHHYGWDAEGNLITNDGNTGTFDALNRRVELGSALSYDQMLYPPFAPTYQLSLAQGLTAVGIRMPLPGGGQAIFGSGGLTQYRHPNWQGSQVVLSWASGSPNPNVGGAFTAFGEKYATYSGGDNGFFAGMLGIANGGAIGDAYQATARLYHQDEGRWVSPDPAGMAAVDPTDPQTWNRYAYLRNNPLSGTDPSGLGQQCPAGQVWQAGPGGDGGKCVSADSPSTTQSSFDLCGTLMALHPFGGLPPNCAGGALFISNAYGSAGMDELRNAYCSAVPTGRSVSVSGALGGLGAVSGGGDMVLNYNSGLTSLFATGGMSFGWNGGASVTATSGLVYGLDETNNGFSGPFKGGSFYAATPIPFVGAGGSVVNSGSVTVLSAGASAAFGKYGVGLSVTNTTKPLNVGIFAGFSLGDFVGYLARRPCN